MITIGDLRVAIGANTVKELTRLTSPPGTDITSELEEETAQPFIDAVEAEVLGWFNRGVVDWTEDASNAALTMHVARLVGTAWIKAANDGREVPSCTDSVTFIKSVAFGRVSLGGLETTEGTPYVN